MRVRGLLAGIVVAVLVAPTVADAVGAERLLPLGAAVPGGRNAGCQFISRQEVVAALGRSGVMGQYNFGEGNVCNIGKGNGLIMIDVFDTGPNSVAGARIDARGRRVGTYRIEHRIPGLGREAWKTEHRMGELVVRQVTVSVRQRHIRVRQDVVRSTPRSKIVTLAQLVRLARSIEARLDA